MLPEERVRQSQELLNINKNKLEETQAKLSHQMTILKQYQSQLHQAKNNLENSKSPEQKTANNKQKSTNSQVANPVINNQQSQTEVVSSELKASTTKKPQTSQSQKIVVENYDATSAPIYDELFWGYGIRKLKEKANNKDTITIAGWVLGKKSPVVAVEIVTLGSVLKTVSVNQLRPGIAKRYPQVPQAKEIGFTAELLVKNLPPKFDWQIQAVFADETRMPIGCIRIAATKSPTISTTPLLTPKAIQFLEYLLKQKPDANVLEFGSGGSTIWLSKFTKNLVSIEHDARWFNQVKNQVQKQENCHPVDIKLLSRPYHTICEQFPDESFDLIIVDGRDRVKCFEASIRLLKRGGILMLDDAQREKYKPAHDLLKDWQVTRTFSKARHTDWWQQPFQVTKQLNQLQETPSSPSSEKLPPVEESQSIPIGKSEPQGYNKWPAVHGTKESVIIAGVSMVKDEEDIVYYTLAGNYRQGIKRFVVLDHMSTDRTGDEIRRFANDYPEAMVYLIEDRDPMFHKFRKVTAAAEFAHRIWGSEWIFPFDADEVLCSLEKPLHEVLSQVNHKHHCIGLAHRNHIISSFYDENEPNPLKRMTHRQKNDTILFQKGYSKVMVRWQPGMVIDQGHHAVKHLGKRLAVRVLGRDIGLILRQYRYRSKDQIRLKIINGGQAYEATKDISANCGSFWQNQYKQYQQQGEKFIDEFYARQINGNLDAIYDPIWI